MRSWRRARGVRGALRALGAVMVAVAGLLALGAGPAGAHAASQAPSSNYVSEITAVTPAASGFTVTIIEAGSRLEVVWRSGPELTVEGYDGEPYLRIGADGVQENVLSPATSVNKSRSGGTVDPDADSSKPPVWRKVSGAHVARWHDHRIHWMGGSRPPAVAAAPGTSHLVQAWELGILAGDSRYVVQGDLRWVPGPSPAPWFGLAAAVAVVAVLAAVAVRARRLAWGIGVGAAFAALAVLVAVDVVHLVGLVWATKGSTASAVGRFFTSGYGSLLGWIVAVIAFVLVRKRTVDALYLVVFAGAVLALVGGLSDLSVLSHTSVPFAFSATVARACVALTLGLGLGAVVLGVVLTGTGPAKLGGAADRTGDRAGEAGEAGATGS